RSCAIDPDKRYETALLLRALQKKEFPMKVL
ncbi:hypothetical protein Pgy4_28730, partial [Pseudomonas savastanoi pv. glycinea str. race 4]